MGTNLMKVFSSTNHVSPICLSVSTAHLTLALKRSAKMTATGKYKFHNNRDTGFEYLCCSYLRLLLSRRRPGRIYINPQKWYGQPAYSLTRRISTSISIDYRLHMQNHPVELYTNGCWLGSTLTVHARSSCSERSRH